MCGERVDLDVHRANLTQTLADTKEKSIKSVEIIEKLRVQNGLVSAKQQKDSKNDVILCRFMYHPCMFHVRFMYRCCLVFVNLRDVRNA